MHLGIVSPQRHASTLERHGDASVGSSQCMLHPHLRGKCIYARFGKLHNVPVSICIGTAWLTFSKCRTQRAYEPCGSLCALHLWHYGHKCIEYVADIIFVVVCMFSTLPTHAGRTIRSLSQSQLCGRLLGQRCAVAVRLCTNTNTKIQIATIVEVVEAVL